MTLLSKRKHLKKVKKLTALAVLMLMLLSITEVFFVNNNINAASSHTTTITLSSEQVSQNSSITLKAEARIDGNISTSGCTYRFLYNTPGEKRATILCDYSNSNVYTFNPSNISGLKDYTGAVYIFADAKNSSGTSVWSSYKILNIIPNDDEALKATGSVTSAGSYTVGDSLIITMTASGGKAPYTYKYEYCKSGSSYSTYKNYTDTSSITMPTSSWTANTDYNVRVTVKDSDGKTFSYISAVRLSAKSVPNPEISSFTVQSTAKIGEKVRLSCVASSGTTPYQYKFTYITPSGAEKIIKEKSDDTDYTNKSYRNWNTTGLSEGNYTLTAHVKDNKGKSATKTTNIKISKTPTLAPTISTDPTSADVVKGKDITFIVDDHASNTEDYPPHPYKFKFEYKKDGASKYNVLRDYSNSDSSNEKYKLSTKDLSAGKYILRATIKDNNGKEYSKTCYFTVTVPKITFSIDAGSKEFFTGGGNEKATIAVNNVKGGISDSYEYKFEYIKYGELNSISLTPPDDDSDWQSIKNFSSENTTDFTVDSADDAGIYAIRVSVQNTDNSDSTLIYRQIIKGYTVKVKVEHTLTDLNTLIDKVDTWTQNSIQSLDMVKKLAEWKEDGNEHFDEYPFVFADYEAAYNAAKSANTDGNKDYDTLYANLETQFDALKRLVESGYVSPGLDDERSPMGFTNMVFGLYKSMLNTLTDTFVYLAGDNSVTSALYSYDFNSAADSIFPLFKTFAYAIIIILAGINAIESALQYEIFTMRGGVKLLGRLVFAKVWVDLSLVICRGILSISIGWLSDITALTKEITNNINFSLSVESSNIWIIGWIVDFFKGVQLASMILTMILPISILLIAIFVKLFVRSFEIAILQCVAPVFFACLTGEETKPYFKKFILSYISTVFEVVFMAIVWYIYIQYLNGMFSGANNAGLSITSISTAYSMNGGFFSFILVSIGAFILMIKPPRILKNLITA